MRPKLQKYRIACRLIPSFFSILVKKNVDSYDFWRIISNYAIE